MRRVLWQQNLAGTARKKEVQKMSRRCIKHEFGSEWVDAEDDSERLSVYDAALIWMSNGKDEDYTFGYTEEELEDAL